MLANEDIISVGSYCLPRITTRECGVVMRSIASVCGVCMCLRVSVCPDPVLTLWRAHDSRIGRDQSHRLRILNCICTTTEKARCSAAPLVDDYRYQVKYTVSQKNDTGVRHYNFDADQPIVIIFGR